MRLGAHTIKSWSKTQTLLALSSGESEFYAALKAAAEGLGLLSMMKDFGYLLKGEVYGDASAALGIIHRKGLGRTRHIDTGLLWIQQTAAEKRLQYFKASEETTQRTCSPSIWPQRCRGIIAGTSEWISKTEGQNRPHNCSISKHCGICPRRIMLK